MANTYTLIASSTVGSGGVADITFSAIPSTYTDLSLIVSARSVFGPTVYEDLRLEFNGSGGTAYSTRMVYGDGSSANSASTSSNAKIFWSFFSSDAATANTFGSIQIYIPNYAGSNYKSISSDSAAETNATATVMALASGLWSDTAAITSIKMTTSGAVNLMQYTTAYLYGISSS